MARAAAEAAECASRQGKFWQMSDRLFGDSPLKGPAAFVSAADSIGLSPEQFQGCLADPRTSAVVKELADRADALRISGTPTFLIGIIDGSQRVRVLRRITGAQPLPVFRGSLEAVLRAAQE
jgi:protein-disulfide isomerase